jgi:hypothetical protein
MEQLDGAKTSKISAEEKGYKILGGRRVSRISEAEEEEAYVVETGSQSRRGTNETLEDLDMDERECPVSLNPTKQTMKPLNAKELNS